MFLYDNVISIITFPIILTTAKGSPIERFWNLKFNTK